MRRVHRWRNAGTNRSVPVPMKWSAHLPGAAASLTAAALWTVLAWRTPTSTHHFAPLVAAGIWGYVTRNFRLEGPALGDRLFMLVGGFGVALAGQVVLSVANRLNGPPLISAIPVPAELVIMAVLGSIIGSGAWRLLGRPGPANEP